MVGMCGTGWRGAKGENWDNSNCIIKYIKKIILKIFVKSLTDYLANLAGTSLAYTTKKIIFIEFRESHQTTIASQGKTLISSIAILYYFKCPVLNKNCDMPKIWPVHRGKKQSIQTFPKKALRWTLKTFNHKF